MTYSPSTIHLGGLTASSSLLEKWAVCPQLFFLEYLSPHPDHPNSNGLTSFTSAEPLLYGTLWHSAMEAYRQTGWDAEAGVDTGNYNAEATIAYIEGEAAGMLASFESEPQMEETRDHVLALFRKWVASRDIITDWRTAAIPGTKLPMTEHELAITIAGFSYTVKVDAGAFTPEGYFQIVEYKTSRASYLSMAQREAQLSIQARGEALALYTHYGQLPLKGVRFEYAVKDRGAKSDLPQFPALELDYDTLQLESFQQNVERWLFEITSKVESFNRLLSRTNDALAAGREAFPMSGMAAKTCFRFNRPCAFLEYCESGGKTSNIAYNRLAPRLVGGVPWVRPDTGTAPLMDVDPSQL